jgi:GWxTD domain-containing protein
MKYIVGAVLFLLTIAGHAQPLRDINYNFLYDPAQRISAVIKVTKNPEGFVNFFKIQWKDTASQFTVKWELRNMLSDKEGTLISEDKITSNKIPGGLTGKVSVALSGLSQILVAKLTNETEKKAWLFHRILDPAYPVNGYLVSGGEEILEPFAKAGKQISFQGPSGVSTITHYSDNFPTSAPIFSETQAKVSRQMKADSVFTITTAEPVVFSQTGLYLIQHDTAAAEGVAFRVQEDYPRLAKIESLADPLVYICTKLEFDKIKAAKGDKKAFDKVILGITGDTERARDFMRSYFRRIELANLFFTSYKEGWKTDRGMCYTIFGLPDEVFKFADREVWNYKSSSYKITLTFAKSGTIFDPDNFVLIRHRKYQDTWYEVIDLWRNARF